MNGTKKFRALGCAESNFWLTCADSSSSPSADRVSDLIVIGDARSNILTSLAGTSMVYVPLVVTIFTSTPSMLTDPRYIAETGYVGP